MYILKFVVIMFWSLKITRHHFVLSGANKVIQAMISDVFQDKSNHRRILFFSPKYISLTSEACRNKKVMLSSTPIVQSLSLLTTMVCSVRYLWFVRGPGPSVGSELSESEHLHA